MICLVHLGNAAVVEFDFAGWSGQFDSGGSCGFRAHLDPLRDIATLSNYGERDLGSSIAPIFKGHRDQVRTFIRFPRMHRLYPDIRQAAIVIYPVAKEPAQVALGGGFD